MHVLDLIFPKRCVVCKKAGSYICDICFSRISFATDMICLLCNRGSLDGKTHPGCVTRYTIDGAFSSMAYKNVVKKLTYTFKYQPYLADLHHILSDLFYEGLIQQELFYTTLQTIDVIMPIPLHSSRYRQRGYNHAALLAKDLSTKLSLPYLDCLERTRRTKPQAGLSQKERKENIKGAFALKKHEEVQGKSVLLIDDILTSGATLAEAATVLKHNGANAVFAATLARD